MNEIQRSGRYLWFTEGIAAADFLVTRHPAINRARTVLQNCKGSLCAISEPDHSVSKDPMDTVHFVSASPIKSLIDYDVLLASEIYEIEFFVRRYNEGGRPLVAACADIMQEVADMAAEQPQ